MPEPLIICDNLVKIYRVAGRDVVALQGLDMLVGRGELLGVVGVSGSGKSTLMNILGGLDRPTAGRVWVDGKDLLKLNDTQLDAYRLLQVGFVWQQTSRNLVSYLNAQQNVELPLTLAGGTGARRRKRVGELLEMVGIESRRKHKLSELSGGEQQRVGIAVALANNPSLLLADEPTGEVDEKTAQSLYNLFRRLNKELGLTTLIVSHDPKLAHQVDRVISIRDGKVSTESKVVNGRATVQLGAVDDGSSAAVPGDGSTAPEAQSVIQELIVVDSAGRLQVPKELLQQYNIRRRVHLEPLVDGLLIKPVVEEPHLAQSHDSAEQLIDTLEESRRTSKTRTWIARLGKRFLRGGRHDDA
jgi:ABC-type lipoprotein export system ATPase subunit/bifunctional DNA-binding transcriptional regulator/antitoxin component of YhaV-PrlF toxin-antitoxin module